MMMKSEQGYMTPLSTSMELEDALAAPIAQDNKLSLTPLWEYVIRAQTLPESLDLDAFFETIHERLRDAEWEVRQHALRVLVDFIPLIPNHVLDKKISSVLSDLVANLGHLGPAVRKGAVDSLRAYVNHTEKTDYVITDLVERGIEKAQENKVHTNVVLGIILSLPFLINNKLSDETITYIIHRLLDKIVKVIHQETVLRALLRIREIIGYERFNEALVSHESYNSKKEFDLLCEVYDLHTFRNASRLSFRQSTFGSSTESTSYNQDSIQNRTILKPYSPHDTTDSEKLGQVQSSFQESSDSERFGQVQTSPYIYQNLSSQDKLSYNYQDFDKNKTHLRYNQEIVNKSPSHSYQYHNLNTSPNYYQQPEYSQDIIQNKSSYVYHQDISQNNSLPDYQQEINTKTSSVVYHQDINQNKSPSRNHQEQNQNNSPFDYQNVSNQNISSRSTQGINQFKSPLPPFYQDVIHQNKTILKPYHMQEGNVKTYVKTEDVLEEVPNVDLENDRVILETEIQLESGPAITMKIHEESGNRDKNEERNRTFKVLPDSDGEDYEHLRRTPRRVRFGGEIVKLRTPDSDSNMHSDDNEATISIISGENGDKPVIEIKYIENETKTTTTTTRSLIPIPVKQTQSEPNSPVRPNLHRSKLYKSSPNLSRNKRGTPGIQVNKSRIPKRFNTEVKKSVETKIQIKISENTKGKPKKDDREQKGKDIKDIRSKYTDNKGNARDKDKIKDCKDNNLKDVDMKGKLREKIRDGKSRDFDNEAKPKETETSSKVGLLDKPKDNSKPKLKSPMPKKEERRLDYNPARRNSREDEFSPIPIHNEIEVLYNLTRSPSPTSKHRNEPFSFNMCSVAIKQQRNGQSSLKERYDETSIINTTENYKGEPRRFSNETKSRNVYSARESGISKQKEEERKLPDINVTQKIGERRIANQHFDIIAIPPPQSQMNQNSVMVLKKTDDMNDYSSFQIQQGSRKSEMSNESSSYHEKQALKSDISHDSSHLQTQQNQALPSSKQEGDFPSFQVYNSSLSDSFYEFADSPIPTKDSGECLTCSSSGSDTVVQEKRRMDQFSVLDERIIEDLQNMEDVRARQRGLEELLRVIQNPNIMDALQGRLPSLLYILFMAEQQPILQPIAEQTLSILFTNMNQQSLISRLQQISLNLSKMGSPLGVRFSILLMRRIPPGLMVDQLLSDPILGAKSSKIREGALQILMTVSRIFPSTDLNILKSSKSVIAILKDKKRRVRQAALETLAALGQLSSPMAILEVANEITADWSDREQILRVIRTRLSRKQLPTVNMNGSIRYSTPTGEPEIEWLSRGSGTLSPQQSTRNTRRFSARCPQDTNNNFDGNVEEKKKRFYSAQMESITTNESSGDNLTFDINKNANGFLVLENPKHFLEESKDTSASFSSEYNENRQESSVEINENEPNILKITYEDSQIVSETEEKKAILRIQDTQDSSFNVSQEQTTDNVSSSDGNKKSSEIVKSPRTLAPEPGETVDIKSPRRFVPDSEDMVDERFIMQNRFNSIDGKEDFPKSVGSRRHSLVDGISDNREEVVYAVAGVPKVNYWRNNRRRQMIPGDEGEGDRSDWSRGSGRSA